MLSYLIVVAAAVLFFAVCYWFISRSHAEETAASAAAPVPSIKKRERLIKIRRRTLHPQGKLSVKRHRYLPHLFHGYPTKRTEEKRKHVFLQNQSWNIPDQSRQLIKNFPGKKNRNRLFWKIKMIRRYWKLILYVIFLINMGRFLKQ